MPRTTADDFQPLVPVADRMVTMHVLQPNTTIHLLRRTTNQIMSYGRADADFNSTGFWNTPSKILTPSELSR